MSLVQLSPFMLAVLLLEVTPGPNMGLLTITAASQGRRAGIIMAVGIALGLLVIGTMASLGGTQFVTANPAYYEALRWTGLIYLLYLAFDLYQSPTLSLQQAEQQKLVTNSRFGRLFSQGLLTNLFNPKAGLFFLIALPQFIPSSLKTENVLPVDVVLGMVAIYVAIATLIHITIICLAGSLQPVLQRSSSQKTLKTNMAVMLIGVTAWQFFATAR
jgi:threonine/homoserine/homoserine lactone efflux protein